MHTLWTTSDFKRLQLHKYNYINVRQILVVIPLLLSLLVRPAASWLCPVRPAWSKGLDSTALDNILRNNGHLGVNQGCRGPFKKTRFFRGFFKPKNPEKLVF